MKKATIAGKTPQMETLEEGKRYAYCTCGNTENQPWCNGAHKGGEFSPQVIKVEETKTAAICMCRQTSNPPYCDGSHRSL